MAEAITVEPKTIKRLCYDYLRVVYDSVSPDENGEHYVVTEEHVEALYATVTSGGCYQDLSDQFPYNYVR